MVDQEVFDHVFDRAKAIAAERDALAARLAHIAAIAHDGGLWSADDHKLWVAIRQLTLPYWQNGGDFNERRQRIAAAMSAADSASVARCDAPGCTHWQDYGRACETCSASVVTGDEQ